MFYYVAWSADAGLGIADFDKPFDAGEVTQDREVGGDGAAFAEDALDGVLLDDAAAVEPAAATARAVVFLTDLGLAFVFGVDLWVLLEDTHEGLAGGGVGRLLDDLDVDLAAWGDFIEHSWAFRAVWVASGGCLGIISGDFRGHPGAWSSRVL